MANNPSGLAGKGGGLGRAPGNEHTIYKLSVKRAATLCCTSLLVFL